MAAGAGAGERSLPKLRICCAHVRHDVGVWQIPLSFWSSCSPALKIKESVQLQQTRRMSASIRRVNAASPYPVQALARSAPQRDIEAAFAHLA